MPESYVLIDQLTAEWLLRRLPGPAFLTYSRSGESVSSPIPRSDVLDLMASSEAALSCRAQLGLWAAFAYAPSGPYRPPRFETDVQIGRPSPQLADLLWSWRPDPHRDVTVISSGMLTEIAPQGYGLRTAVGLTYQSIWVSPVTPVTPEALVAHLQKLHPLSGAELEQVRKYKAATLQHQISEATRQVKYAERRLEREQRQHESQLAKLAREWAAVQQDLQQGWDRALARLERLQGQLKELNDVTS